MSTVGTEVGDHEPLGPGCSRQNSLVGDVDHLRYTMPRPNLHTFDRGFNPLDYEETVKQLDIYYGIGR